MIAIIFLILPQFKKWMKKEGKIRYNLQKKKFVKFYILLYQELDFMDILNNIFKKLLIFIGISIVEVISGFNVQVRP